MRAKFATLILVLSAALWASTGHAQESPEYSKAIKQAVAEFDAGNWLEARVLFQRAHTLSPNARTWRSLGLTAFELRRYVDAIGELEAALADSRKPLSDKQRTEVQQLLSRAREFVAVYQVSVAPEGAEVIVDGKSVVLENGQLFLDPGAHTVVVRAPGYLEERKDLRIDEPHRDQLSIELKVAGQETQEIAVPTPVQQDVSTPAEPPQRKPRIWTWVLGGTGLAVIATGVGLGVAAGKKNDDFKACTSDDCSGLKSKGQGLQLGANLSYGIGGALLVGSVVAWFLEGRSSAERPPKTAFYVTPWSAGVQGRF